MLTEAKNFKTFLKQSYAIALASCYKMLSMELGMMLIALIEFAYNRHS